MVIDRVESLGQADEDAYQWLNLAFEDFRKAGQGPPGWRSGPRHCIAVLAVPPKTLGLRPGSVAAGDAQLA